MKIVIEGPNNVGKSTLLKELHGLQWLKGCNVEYFGQNTPKTLKFYTDVFNDFTDLICDRFMISELVYSKYYGRSSNITIDDTIKLLNDVSVKDDVIIIFVDAQYEFIVNSYKNKCETFDYEFVRNERLSFREYEEQLNRKCPNCKIIHVSNTVNELFSITGIINEILLQRR